MKVYKIRDKESGLFVTALLSDEQSFNRKNKNAYAILGWKGRLFTEWGSLMRFTEKLATSVRGHRDLAHKYTHEEVIQDIMPYFEIVCYSLQDERIVTSVKER